MKVTVPVEITVATLVLMSLDYQTTTKQMLFPVIDVVYTFANALNQFLANDSNCDQPVQWYRANYTCKGQRRQLDGSNLLEYIANIDFDSPTGNRIVFNANGAVEGKYDIINFQVVDSGGVTDFSYQTVGLWDSSLIGGEFLKLNEDMLQFGLDDLGNIVQDPPISQCGNCVQGQYLKSNTIILLWCLQTMSRPELL